jgi:hypothetical protein
MQSISYCGLSQLFLYINRTDCRSTKAASGFRKSIKKFKTLQMHAIFLLISIIDNMAATSWQGGKNGITLCVNIEWCRTNCSEVNEQYEVAVG